MTTLEIMVSLTILRKVTLKNSSNILRRILLNRAFWNNLFPQTNVPYLRIILKIVSGNWKGFISIE